MRLRLIAAMMVMLGAGAAHADVVPDGKKSVRYTMKIENTTAFPDYVFLVFPWSIKGGVGSDEHALIEEGKETRIGARTRGNPEIYAAKKTDYEQAKRAFKAKSEGEQDPELRAFFASDKVIKCDEKLSPQHWVDEASEIASIVESFRVEAIDGSKCDLSVPKKKAADANANELPDKVLEKNGCMGCTIDAQSHQGAGVTLVALGALAIGLRRRGLRRHSVS